MDENSERSEFMGVLAGFFVYGAVGMLWLIAMMLLGDWSYAVSEGSEYVAVTTVTVAVLATGLALRWLAKRWSR